MNKSVEVFLKDESETLSLGARFARNISFQKQTLVFLKGDLGAGKTTFVRGFLQALGYRGLVKSPTFTLVEPYVIDHKNIFHFDLYRLKAPSELEHIGLEDYFSQNGLFIFEWPEKGEGYLPAPDVVISFEVENTGRRVRVIADKKIPPLL